MVRIQNVFPQLAKITLAVSFFVVLMFRSSKYNGISTPDEYLEYCVREQSSGSCIPRICAFSKPIRTCKPFPHIFDPRVSVDGNILGKQR